MSRMKIVAAAVWLIAAGLFVFYGRGSFGQAILLVMSTFIAAGCWGVGGLFLLIAGRGPSRWREAGRAALLLGTLSFGLWISFPFGMVLHDRDVAEAKAFCEGLIPAIERHKAEAGRYPETPPGLDEPAARPRLLDRGPLYHADANGYSFSFMDSAGMLDAFEYDSRAGRWREVD